MSSKSLVGLIIGIISLLFVGISLGSSWWGVSVAAAGAPSSGVGFYDLGLDGMRSTIIKTGNQTIKSGPWDSMSSPLGEVHRTTRLLAYVALIGALVPVVVNGLAMSKKLKPRLAGAMSLVMGFLIFPAPIYYSFTVAGAWRQHVSGVTPEDQVTGFWGSQITAFGFASFMSWGPGGGWWVIFLGGIIALIGGAYVASKEKETPPPAPAAAPPAFVYLPVTYAQPIAVMQAPPAIPAAPAAPPPTTAASPPSSAQPSPTPQPSAASPGTVCPFCGGAASWVAEYGKWYCHRCGRYPWG